MSDDTVGDITVNVGKQTTVVGRVQTLLANLVETMRNAQGVPGAQATIMEDIRDNAAEIAELVAHGSGEQEFEE
jgi:hypothetical protein